MIRTDRDFYKELYYSMLLIREFEEEVKRLYAEGAIHGTLHLCFGEEAVDAGSTAVLGEADYVFPTHRGHGVCIGRGVDIRAMMAELLGRSTGTNMGRGGSMHICDIKKGIIGSNGIVGANGPLACGAALAAKSRHVRDCVSVCFTGDGAANSGAMLEAMNLAGLWKLPVIFVLVENHYAVSTTVERGSANTDFSVRAEAFGLGCFEADGNDVLEVADTMSRAREYVLSNERPCLVIEHTYRVAGHSRSDQNKYRTEEEIRYWKDRGPIVRFRKRLLEELMFTEDELAEMESLAAAQAREASDHALSQPVADESIGSLVHAVYAD